MSPLEIAVRNKDPKTVKFLLELGADPNTLAGIEKKMGFEIPMIFIALTGFNLPESVRTLQSSGVACDSENPKNHVFSQEELDIIKALVDHGADLNTHSFTKLLIFTALEFKDKNPVKILLRSFLTKKQRLEKLKMFRLAEKVNQLRDEGHDIKTVLKEKNGRVICEYHLKGKTCV